MAEMTEPIIVKKKAVMQPITGRVESGLRRLRYGHDGPLIVLWMMNASKQVQEAVGGYSRIPGELPRWWEPTEMAPENPSP